MSQDWMPTDLTPEEKQAFSDANQTDPHAAAADAWESWAASLPLEESESVSGISTGSQSISYRSGGGQHSLGMSRAAWHRSRARVRSVEVGPEFERGESEIVTVQPLARRSATVQRDISDGRVDEWGNTPVWHKEAP